MNNPLQHYVKNIFMSLLLILFSQHISAQFTLTFQPDATAGKDAYVSNALGEATVNNGTSFLLMSQGVNVYPRQFYIQFNLGTIPSNATVISAKLYLYAYDPGNGGHIPTTQYFGVGRVTSSWNESTVTWNTKPGVTTEMSFPGATTANQDFQVDVRNITQFMVSNAGLNYGYAITGTTFGRVCFASSDHSNPALRPKLEVTYAICSGTPPPAVITPSAPQTICMGSSQAYTVNTGPGYVYQWYKGVNQYISSGTTINATSSGTYKVVVTNPQGCTATSAAATLNVNLETVDIRTQYNNSSSEGCINGSGMVMNADTAAGYGFQWRKNGNNINGATSYTYTAHDTGMYSCVISNAGCSIISNGIEGKLFTASAVTTEPTNTCNGTTTLLTNSQPFPLSAHQWQKNNVDIPGATSWDYDATSTGLYRVIATTGYCPVSITTNAISVNTNTSPLLELQSSPVTGNPVNTCSNNPTTLTLYHVASEGGTMFTNTTNTTYEWYVNNVPDPNMYWFQEFAAGSARYTVQVITPCGSMGYTKELHAAAPGVPGPDFTINNGCDSVKLNFSNFNYPWNSYQWKLNGVPVPGATGAEYYAKTSGNYSCLVDNGCDTTTSTTKAVNIITSATALPAGPINMCSGNVTIYTTYVQGYTYQWTKNGVNIFQAINSSYMVTSSGNYACKVTSNGCMKTTNTVVVNFGVPTATIAANGGTTICTGGSTLLYIQPLPTNISFQWKKNNVAITGATLSSYQATTPGDYICEVTTSCGLATSNLITLTLSGAAPAIPSAVTGVLRPCAGSSGIIYSVSNVAGNSYTWNLPAGVTMVSGQGTNSITVNFSAAFVNGSVSVTPVNGCGAGPARSVLLSKETPRTPGPISGTKDGLCNISNAVFSIAATPNATTYLWTLPAGATVNSGQGTTSITATFPSGFITGTVSVKAGSACGYGAARNLTVKGTPATPAAVNGPATVCANQQSVIYNIAAVPGAATYTWTVPNGAIIVAGQGTTSITTNFASTSGLVRARASNSCGVGTFRNLSVNIVCREGESQLNNSLSLNIYPNPSKNYFLINVSGVEEDDYTMTVTDIIGKEISRSENNSALSPIEFGSEFAPGIYFVTVKCGEETKVMRLVKE